MFQFVNRQLLTAESRVRFWSSPCGNSVDKVELGQVVLRVIWFLLSFLLPPMLLNLLKPTGYVMQQQFNIQQRYVLPTLYLCVLYLSENKQRLVPLTG